MAKKASTYRLDLEVLKQLDELVIKFKQNGPKPSKGGVIEYLIRKEHSANDKNGSNSRA